MAKVIGLGGIFFRSRDPAALGQWYATHLGLEVNSAFGGAIFAEDEARPGYTLWTPFAAHSDYLGEPAQACMINFRVDDLDALLARLADAGVWVDERREEGEFGRFGWIRDPDGHRVELWQPPG
ncbi:VOC family protein [Dyella sp.]|jgi:catechol 2,3-dioxygenase-like lactoylglutathione lyase family enzyme|uniref:VOC family protein n=1 Tax=Dyella sp. TaxID=1869338 RepID=UPI002D798573|nr:VOC family protein [Dyella sp.]HET6430717.1 VOC family protein [Dyella sp.]